METLMYRLARDDPSFSKRKAQHEAFVLTMLAKHGAREENRREFDFVDPNTGRLMTQIDVYFDMRGWPVPPIPAVPTHLGIRKHKEAKE